MTDERLIIAIGRLERALTRVEVAAVAGERGELDAIVARHQKLRAKTQQAIEALDRLTATIA